MNLFKLSLKNLLSRPLGTLLCLILLTLGTGLISLVFQLNREFDSQLTRNLKGISMVVGAKGSPLQLVLSTVYHLDNPTGNISWSQFKREVLDQQSMIAKAIPINLGDNYQGFPIVGSTTDFPALYGAELAEGELGMQSMELTLGARVAQQLGLRPGDEVISSHALVAEGEEFGQHDDHPYRVKGIFKATGTVLDRLLVTDLGSTYEVHNHNQDSSLQDQVTAVLVSFRSPMAALMVPRIINQNTTFQAAVPSMEVTRLLDLLGVGTGILRSLGAIILFLSAFSVFISLLNSLRDRKPELALMRVLGAGPGKLFLSILLEGIWLSLAGFLLGIGLSRLVLLVIPAFSPNSAPFAPDPWQVSPEEPWIFLLTLGIGLLASVIPALLAMKTNLHKTLSDG
ncbi:MAG: FtsX-like permease family protein [Bacteroidia bacterium]|nr:FtsX-like permease family protein [Bacteroidia bacterium]